MRYDDYLHQNHNIDHALMINKFSAYFYVDQLN